MAFGKLVVGIILVGVGALLLAAPLGFLPAGVWPWLLKFWPFLLLGLGLALLANALKNVVLGVFATALVVGSLVFGAFWISKHTEAAKMVHESTIDLRKPRVHAVTVQGRSLGGSFTVATEPDDKGWLRVSVLGVPGKENAAARWAAAQGAGLLQWPARPGLDEAATVGGRIDVRTPAHTKIRCDWRSYLSSANADMTRLQPERCDFDAIGSSIRLTIGQARPSRIRVQGFLSNTEIHLPADCPVRIEFSSLLSTRSLPEDFLEHVSGRSGPKATYWTADGSGKPLLIRIEGPFMRLRVTREPLKAI